MIAGGGSRGRRSTLAYLTIRNDVTQHVLYGKVEGYQLSARVCLLYFLEFDTDGPACKLASGEGDGAAWLY
jgi:hypothetical protein